MRIDSDSTERLGFVKAVVHTKMRIIHPHVVPKLDAVIYLFMQLQMETIVPSEEKKGMGNFYIAFKLCNKLIFHPEL